MTRNFIALTAASMLMLTTTAPAFAAGDQASVDACRSALAEQFPGAEINYKSMRGASVQKIKFIVETPGGEQTVTCKFKRGAVIALDGAVDAPRVAAQN